MHRLNGVPVEKGAVAFDLSDRGLTLGDGLFETIAAFDGRPALLEAHLDRLSAAAAEIRLPVDRDFLAAEVAALAQPGTDAVIRLTVTRGGGARGLAFPGDPTPTVIASASAYPKAALFSPARLAGVSVRRNPTSFASRAKTLSYLDNVIAFDEARAAGADDALMLNVAGRVGSTAMANLFAILGDELVTPPLSEGVLPGIIRAAALELAPTVGLEPVERALATEELMRADAVFATNSVRLVMTVKSIDGAEISGAAEPLVARLASAIAHVCGAPQRA
ncbi:aminotransferase class IV [Hansschlegelia sp.]|uniref:aminotransferase class IV n=1 Tax=Hansschlegelia sp. TaxID=2041892 RepID=UPI002C8D4BF2|nr:aminotransferase class IV [Hansschlegelia sp.]HVI30221.1 aminotransferase class IV [Hansschlegelia sp.]